MKKRGFVQGASLMGLISPLNNGSGRQWLKVKADHCLLLPEQWSLEEGAAFPEGAVSALLATSFSRKKKPGKVLVFGASGGVGSLVVQILSARGWTVSAVCRENQRGALANLGCRHFIDRFQWKEKLEALPRWDAIVDCPAAIIKNNPRKYLKWGGVYAPVYIPDPFIPFQILRTVLWFFSPWKTGLLLGYPSKGRMMRIRRLITSVGLKPLISFEEKAESICPAVRKSKEGGNLGKIIILLTE